MQNEKSKSLHFTEEMDRLSTLLNRHAGEVCLEKELKKAILRNQLLCVALIDINDITDINTKYGHDAGDAVIQQVAQCLKQDLQQEEYAARFSGDEFLCIYPAKQRQEIHDRLQKIMEYLARKTDQDAFHISFCYGLTVVEPTQKITAKQVIMECDDAMYQWKRRYHLDKARYSITHHSLEDEDARQFSYDTKRLLHALVASTDDYIYVCNMAEDPSTFLYSQAMVKEFGLPHQVIHDAALEWGKHIHEADQQAFLEANLAIADNRSDCHNVEYRAKNCRGEWVWLRCRGHVERDIDGNPILFAGMITDLSKKNKIDHLTGLFNKYEFEDTIEQMLTKKNTRPFSVMLLDLDNFSNINKFHNHRFGDEVLAKTAQQIQSILPQGAKMYRHDGDEFHVIFAQAASKTQMKEVFADIQHIYRTQQELNDRKYHITISAAALSCPDDAADVMNISKNLRYALDHSKRNGRNRLTFYEKGMRLHEMRELDLIEQLRYSIEHDFIGFALHFQPQVDANTKQIVGAEALARWKSDIYGNVPPLIFIPLLEKSGLINEAGKWIFQKAVRYCKEMTTILPTFCVSINLSYIQLSDLQFFAFMKQVLKEEMIDPSHIIVEMTESYMVKNDDMQQTLFHKIRALGIRIAMDDFGTGFSSLGVLKKAPADIVKIDKVFMKDVLTSNFDATFIRFIVTLCHDVNIKVLLEWVETKEEYEKVKTMGLDYIQGYYFGKPQPFRQFKKNCENNTSDV